MLFDLFLKCDTKNNMGETYHYSTKKIFLCKFFLAADKLLHDFALVGEMVRRHLFL